MGNNERIEKMQRSENSGKVTTDINSSEGTVVPN